MDKDARMKEVTAPAKPGLWRSWRATADMQAEQVAGLGSVIVILLWLWWNTMTKSSLQKEGFVLSSSSSAIETIVAGKAWYGGRTSK